MESSENIVTFKVRTFFAVVGGLVIGTNVVNKIVNDIIQNRETIIYNDEAARKRIAHAEEKGDYKITIEFQKLKIEELTENLKECKNENN